MELVRALGVLLQELLPIIGDRLRLSLSWGCSSQIEAATGRVLYTADAFRTDGKRFTVLADDRLTAFLELERAARESSLHVS